jgi:hypothetical protein
MFDPSTRFYQIADRNDARVLLAAELSAKGIEKQLVVHFDEIVKSGIADVFIGDDDDEPVVVKMDNQWFSVTEGGLLNIKPNKAQGLHLTA